MRTPSARAPATYTATGLLRTLADRALGGRIDVVRARLASLSDDVALLAQRGLLDALHLALGLGLDVGLLDERGDGLPEVLPSGGDVAPQLGLGRRLAGAGPYRFAALARCFVHRTSSFTLSTVSSGTGGVAASI